MTTEIIKRFYEDKEHTSIATIEKFPSGKYYIQYGWHEEQGFADCSCGDFATAEEAEEILMKHRPLAEEIKPENPEESKEGDRKMATENFKINSRDKELLDQMFSYMRDVKGDEEFITWAMENQGMTKEELKYYCDIDVETEADRFREYHHENDLICTDIAATLIELSGMEKIKSEDLFEIHRDLENAIRDIQLDAENYCSTDYVRVLWNVLCRLENYNEASGDTWYLIDGWRA